MLNFRNTTILFVVLIALFFIFGAFFTISYWWIPIISLLYISALYFGSSHINSGFHFNVICRAHPGEKGIVLSFDDGPDPVHTEAVLDILKKHEVSALFFVIGSKAEANPRLLQRMHREGHIIGNHSYRHSNFFSLYLPKNMVKELSRTSRAIFEITGVSVRWFRPPYGVTNPWLKRAIRLTGMVPVGWSLRTFDGSTKKTERVMKRLARVKGGDIVLFHDTTPGITNILEGFINMLNRQGFSIASPEAALGIPAYK